ncbi:FAD-dependent oxidoreductase [Halomonas alkaliantarctica]|uniref:FAD-dependent oxidoreductase n=1 Tax=Halomonas alkaliantarctica TaxID=232346 RepID=A0ABY8LSI6_9GAMM|nr:FAD-dependent oxidoreductase [Halomonas alkaliantarctica]WGI27374.1 FAD-dependent oxidoreductase [Halomonas alkaliantarctica]
MPLTRDKNVDIAITGGGYTGLTAAHRLAERGGQAIVVDANPIGWGQAVAMAAWYPPSSGSRSPVSLRPTVCQSPLPCTGSVMRRWIRWMAGSNSAAGGIR